MHGVKLEEGAGYELQQLARHQFIKNMLADIAQDMQICSIEGWDIFEYVEMLEAEIGRIAMMDRRIKKRVKDESTPTGIRVDIYCPDCGKKILSRFARTCPSCNSQVIAKQGKE